MRIFATAFCLAVLVVSARGQRTSAAAHIQLSFPQGDYKSADPKAGVGIRFNVLRRIMDESPFSVGAEFGYMVRGSNSKYFDIYYGGYYDTYKISASNNIMSLAFKARADLLPKERPVLIFVETTIGANLFFSSASIERETYYGNSQYVDGDNSKGYWAFTWGPAIGVEIPVDKRKQAAIVVKGSYLFGARTTYLSDPYIDGNSGTVFFNQNESKTDMILAELGVRFTFPSKRR
jgi:hypothetical protein